MGEVISIVDILREQTQAGSEEDHWLTYDRGMPIFEGRVVDVNSQLFYQDNVLSKLFVIPKSRCDEFPRLSGGDKGEDYLMNYLQRLHDIMATVVVPFPVDKNLIKDADVKSYLDGLEVGTRSVDCYHLDIYPKPNLKATLNVSLNKPNPTDVAFRYIRVIE